MKIWYRYFHRFCVWCYFDRITVVNPQNLPRSQPVFYLGIHRNGAVDGFVYHSILPRICFLISTQLRRNRLGKLFFSGIEVVRGKDLRERDENMQALEQCQDFLRSKGELFIFPEGTSSLGPRHLRFRGGAARILLTYLERGGPIEVIPLSVTYECPWEFRSKVEVIVGPSISTNLPDSFSPRQRLKEIKHRIQSALESVGTNVESEEYWAMIQAATSIARRATGRSYHQVLKVFEKSFPDNLRTEWNHLSLHWQKRSWLNYHGAPIFPEGKGGRCVLELATFIPIVAIAALCNLIPMLCGQWAGKTFSDDKNVISLWRILIGVPLFLINVIAMAVLAIGWNQPLWFLTYCFLTWLGLKLYSPAKRRTIAAANSLFRPELKAQLQSFKDNLLQEIGNEVGNGSKAPS